MAEAQTPPVSTKADVAPWPEPAWGWRRTFAFGASICVFLLIALAIAAGADWKVSGVLGTIEIIIILSYVVGATGEVWIRIFGALSALKSGVTFNQTASASTPAGTATSTSAATPAKTPPPSKPGGGE